MRILLDESLPRRLALEISGHEVQTVQKQGWAGLKNGELLRRASGSFDVLVTGDRNLEFQQNLTKVSIAVVVLIAKSNRIESLRPLVPRLLTILASIQPGQLVRVQEQDPPLP
jgi:predicted nuclease of predicted toxin-antitoxin system